MRPFAWLLDRVRNPIGSYTSRVSSWMFGEGRNSYNGGDRHDTVRTKRNATLAGLISFFSGGPGGWASDHLEETTRLSGWNFVAIRATAAAMAGCSFRVSVVQDDAESVPLAVSGGHATSSDSHLSADDGPVRLFNEPNARDTWGTFVFQVAQQIGTTGSALVWFVPNPLGVPTAAYVIPTALAYPVPPSDRFPFGGYEVRPITTVPGAPTMLYEGSPFGTLLALGGVIPAEQVCEIRWPHPLYPFDGLSPMSAAPTWVDLAQEMDLTTWYGFRNSANPGMVFEQADGGVTDEVIEDFLATLRKRLTEPRNTGRNLVLPRGLRATQGERSLQEVDYQAGREQLKANLLSLHRTPPAAVGIAEPGSYAQWYVALRQFTHLNLEPLGDLIAQQLTRFALARYEPVYGRLKMTIQHPRSADPEMAQARLDSAADRGAITVNEYRAAIGMPPHKDGNVLIGSPSPEQLDMANPAGPAARTGFRNRLAGPAGRNPQPSRN